MFVATNRIRVEKGHGASLEDRFGRQGRVADAPGFRWFQLWKLNADQDYEEYLVVTQWESKESHDDWTRSEDFRRAHSGPRLEGAMGHPQFQSYDVKLSR